MRKMKIYYQYAEQKTLAPTKGDYVNELGIMTALSRFAEVYYSGRLFAPNAPYPYNLQEYPGDISKRVPSDCDLYFVRANKSAFYQAPRGKPKLWMASPFDADCYRDATAVAAFTEAWARGLREGRSYGWMPPEECKPRTNIINMDQVVSDLFRPLKDARKTKEIRASVGGNFIIGHFGRVVASNYPHALFDAWKFVHATFPKTRMLFGITRGTLPNLPGLTSRKFTHSDVPYAISACDLIVLSNWGPEWEICGCGKALESAACGVPVVLGRSEARYELFGEDYPLFIPSLQGPDNKNDVRNMRVKIERVIHDRDLLANASLRLLDRIRYYSVDQASKRLQTLFGSLL